VATIPQSEDAVDVAAPTGEHPARLNLRLAPRPAQAFLLRAHLRLWLTARQATESDVADILLAAHEAFSNALLHAHHPRSIAVSVDASWNDGLVEIAVRDHGRWREGNGSAGGAGVGLQLMHALMDSVELETTKKGTTVRLRRAVGTRSSENGTVAMGPPRDRLELLRRSPVFAPHPEAMLEELAARLIPCWISGDETIIEEGDEGGLFYLIAEGRLDVSAEGCHVATLGPGEFVGEIALLRDVPRTATIVAKEPVVLYALSRDDFLAAVTSDVASARAAETVVAARLSGLEHALARTGRPRRTAPSLD
jgi:CRP-like cAMP-binding protein/anti-sigma regulatory factor (Ser/Thr protein kinase)